MTYQVVHQSRIYSKSVVSAMNVCRRAVAGEGMIKLTYVAIVSTNTSLLMIVAPSQGLDDI